MTKKIPFSYMKTEFFYFSKWNDLCYRVKAESRVI